jgi:hypothetical protein
MARLTGLVEVRDQLLAFLKNAVTGVASADWTTDPALAVPDDLDAAQGDFPSGAVLWTLESPVLTVAPQACGLIDSERLVLWAVFTAKASTCVGAQDAAMLLAGTAIGVLRALAGHTLSYDGDTAAEETRVGRVILSRSRQALKDKSSWYASVAIQVEIENTFTR